MLASGGDVCDIANLEVCPTFSSFEFGQKGKAPKVELKDSEPLGDVDGFHASEGEEDGFGGGGMGGFDGGDIDFDDGGDQDDGDGMANHRFDFNTKSDDVVRIKYLSILAQSFLLTLRL